MSTDALVHFVDPWPDRYRTPVRRAIASLEEVQPQDPALPEADPPAAPPATAQPLWVVSHYAVNGLELFVAQRTENTLALTARSVDELCHNIRELGLRQPRPGALFQLMYKSSATQPMATEDLNTLLERARARNRKLGVTGLLLYKNGRFLQVLEGVERSVREVFASIAQDPRHHHIQIIFTSPVEQRTFPDWQMAFIACDTPGDTPNGEPAAEPTMPLPLGEDLCVRAPLVSNVANALGSFRSPRKHQG